MVEASAYERVAWQSFFASQEAGMEKSLVRVLQTGEEQGMAEYEEEARGLKMERRFGDFLQWSQESSLPVSRTMVTFCGGEPTERETVKVTLWWKESLFEEGLGAGSVWVFKGKNRV